MLLLFDPDPPFVRWCEVDKGVYLEHRTELSKDWSKTVVNHIVNPAEVEAIGYMLYHGGGEITESASVVSKELVGKMERGVGYAPECNEMTLRLVQDPIVGLPEVPHVVCCDTAFFANLPAEASTYAVPYELSMKGIRRYGGYGLYHKWVWDQVKMETAGSATKLLSIFLGNHPNVAAIRNGIAVETSLGFTPVEGIPSSTTSGDIDPTIIFQLLASGISLNGINRVLSKESGFTGLVGKPTDFADIMQRWDDPELATAREVLHYNILKYAGELIATLGGVDAIVFLSEQTVDSARFVTGICHELEFLGVKCRTSPFVADNCSRLSEDDSPVRVSWLRCNRWDIIAYIVTKLTTKET